MSGGPSGALDGSRSQHYDNTITGWFFATLECELPRQHNFGAHAEARTALFEYVVGVYIRRWRYSVLISLPVGLGV